MINVPATALTAIKQGAAPITLLKLVIPEPRTGGGFDARAYLFASAPHDIIYPVGGTSSWSAGSPLLEVRNVGAARRNGELQLVLEDLALTWARRFELGGERGKEVEIHYVIPHGAGLLFPMSVFKGRTMRVAKIRPRGRGADGYGLSIECADAAVYSARTRAQWASDAFQRELAALDDSMEIANKARQLVWHRT